MTSLTRREEFVKCRSGWRDRKDKRIPGYYDRVGKPALDRLIALALLIVTSPILAIAMLLVKLTSRGPALYTQERLGRDGRLFTIYKIRSMYQNSEAGSGPRWCLPNDPRVTPVGRFLRASHIDELPQLWNIFRGELSLVGPRPERPEIATDVERSLPEFRARLSVRPGLSGLAQVQQAPDTSLETVRRKLFYDQYYIANVGLGMDLRILVATALYVVGVPPTLIALVFRFPVGQEQGPPALPIDFVLPGVARQPVSQGLEVLPLVEEPAHSILTPPHHHVVHS
jgi:lipopolysaccharide/colanic/teichoic acid biosynthesis glycosyltransferase